MSATPDSTGDASALSSATSSAGGIQRPISRYGRDAGAGLSSPGMSSPRTRRLVIALFVLVVLVMVAYAGVRWWMSSPGEVSATDAGWEVVDAHHISVTVDVTRDDPHRDAYCILRARDYNGGEIARRDLFVPASDDNGAETVRVQAELRTPHEATIAEVYGCSAEVPEWIGPDAAGTPVN